MACRQRVASQPEYAHLKTKLYLGGDEITHWNSRPIPPARPSKRSARYPVPRRRPALRKECRRRAARAHPLLMLTLVETFQRGQALCRSRERWTYLGRIRSRPERPRNPVATKRQPRGNPDSGAATNQHAFEVQQRQHAAAAFQRWNHQQQVLANQRQAIDAMNAPRTTNCQYIGNTAQCRRAEPGLPVAWQNPFRRPSVHAYPTALQHLTSSIPSALRWSVLRHVSQHLDDLRRMDRASFASSSLVMPKLLGF